MIKLSIVLMLFSVGCYAQQKQNNIDSIQTTEIFDLTDSNHGTLKFYGSEVADLFTKEIEESFKGVLKYNYISKPHNGYTPGFVRASPENQGWCETFWTRDGGTFLRELTQWGYLKHACLTANYLMMHVGKNGDGFYAFPEYFKASEKKSGSELDGTSNIIIALSDLWRALPFNDPFRQTIYQFLHKDSSPLRYLHFLTQKEPLLAGEGEFGGGCFISGKYYNVVQNYLCSLALIAGGQLESSHNEKTTAKLYLHDAEALQENMLKILQNKDDSSWYWCVEPHTMKPDTSILNHPINKGFGGILGVSCMYSDVLGLEPLSSAWKGIQLNENTFNKLLSFPLRKSQFEKYGLWPQFDVFRKGLSSGPSYGDGYALQTMLLYDKMEMADKSLKWIVNSTCNPIPEYTLHRESPYYFYERSYSPDALGKLELEEGCGALNLVNVSEPLKIARLILGVNNTINKVEIFPRLPESIHEAIAANWPVYTSKGIVRANISCKKTEKSYRVEFKTNSGVKIDVISVRLPCQKGFKRKTMKNVSEFVLETSLN